MLGGGRSEETRGLEMGSIFVVFSYIRVLLKGVFSAVTLENMKQFPGLPEFVGL